MKHPADRLSEKKWGVFHHYLYNLVCNTDNPKNLGKGITDWNAAVNCFDVERLAWSLHRMNVGYYFITLTQGTKHMLAPNATYDLIAGTNPGEACATRDLPMEIADELAKYDIDLCLYYTGDGPHFDKVIGTKFGFYDPDSTSKVDLAFCEKWAKVLEEYAVRYGDKVKAWWIDGCYYGEYLGYTDEYLGLYYDAVKKGNPNAAVACNNGVLPKLGKGYPGEDFICGEYNDFLKMPKEKYIDGALAHVLAPLGYDVATMDEWSGWSNVGIRHTREYIRDYIRAFNRVGGAVTVDVHVSIDGSFDPEQEAFLRWVGERV